MVHRNAGVDPRFRVVDAPLDLGFALVWGEFQHKVRHSEPGFVIIQRWFTVQRAPRDCWAASLFEVREPPLGCDAR